MTQDQNEKIDTQSRGRSPGVFDEAFLTDVPDVAELLLIRHARQEWNPEGTAGEMVDPPLSEHGRLQARLLGDSLSTVRLDAIYASPMRRARETVEAVSAHHNLPVTFVDDLREVEVFRDMPPDQTPKEFFGTDLLEAVRQRMINERNWDVYPQSESSYDFKKRTINAFEAIIARNSGQRVVVVCHGGVINAYTGHIIGTPYDMFFRPAHTSVSIVVCGGARRIVRMLNDTHHLTSREGDATTY